MSDEKTEEPTEQKLRKAREEGQVAKSQDMAIAGSTLAVVGTLLAMADSAAARMRTVISLALDIGPGDIPMDVIWKRLAAMGMEAGLVILPLLVVAAIGAVVGIAAHVGIQLTPKAVQPKFDSLNPAQGIKKVFSLKSLMTFAQMVLKAVVIGAVMWQVIVQLLPLISGAVFQTPMAIGAIAWGAIGKVLLFAVALFMVLAPLDYALQRHHFMKGQRMSKDEIKREFKGQEGDPEIKGQRKQLARELAEEDPKQAVGRADEAGVPVVLAKGVDDAALIIRGHAEAMGVPVFAHPPLARALHKVPVDHAVPEELFESVAVVLRWVDEIGARRGDSPGSTPAPGSDNPVH